MTSAVNSTNREVQKNMENLAATYTNEIKELHKVIAEIRNTKSDQTTTEKLEKKLTVLERKLAQSEETTKLLTAELKTVKAQ
jgi:phage shock protein A